MAIRIFFPAGTSFDTAIPTPEQFSRISCRRLATRHDRIVEYFKELARLSPKAHFQIIGYTHEQRLQVVLTITMSENYGKLEDIRKEHLKLSQPGQQVNISGCRWLLHMLQRSCNDASTARPPCYGLVPGGSAGDEANNILRNAIIHNRSQLQSDGRAVTPLG